MRALKLIGALLPVAYCGWLFFHFLGFRGADGALLADGLGPTVLGLGAIALLFCIPLVFRLLKLIASPRAPVPEGRRSTEEVPVEAAFDADAALARYMARKATVADTQPEAAPLPPSGVPAPRPSFGRKIG